LICNSCGSDFDKSTETMTEYQKTEWLHSQLSELIEGNKLPIDELKIMQSFIEDIRQKHFDKNGNLIEGNNEKELRKTFKEFKQYYLKR
jgi:hypothetical protein